MKVITAKKRRSRNGLDRAQSRAFYVIMIPFIVFLLLTKGYPLVWGIYISFTNYTGLNLDKLCKDEDADVDEILAKMMKGEEE